MRVGITDEGLAKAVGDVVAALKSIGSNWIGLTRKVRTVFDGASLATETKVWLITERRTRAVRKCSLKSWAACAGNVKSVKRLIRHAVRLTSDANENEAAPRRLTGASPRLNDEGRSGPLQRLCRIVVFRELSN